MSAFPCFAPHAPDGASRYIAQWLQSLGQAGLAGTVLTTTASRAEPTSAWSSRWPGTLPAGVEAHGSLTIQRFPASAQAPRLVWRVLTRLGLAWRRRASGTWPPFVQRYILAGYGPHSPPLDAALASELDRHAVLLTGYGPLGLAIRAATAARARRRPVAVLPLMHAEDPLHHLPLVLAHLRTADYVFALTEFEAEHIRRVTGRNHVDVIGGGVDLAELEASTLSGARFRQRHELGSGPLALFLGRKESGKRYPLALEAVRQSGHPDLRLMLIGPDVDRVPVVDPLARYLGPLPRADVLDALDACDVLINPSTSESFGLTVLEAWARRKPVIVNAACGPFRSIVRDGQDGLWARDAADMAAALNRLLTDPDLATRLGQAGHHRLGAYFNWPATALRTRAALEAQPVKAVERADTKPASSQRP